MYHRHVGYRYIYKISLNIRNSFLSCTYRSPQCAIIMSTGVWAVLCMSPRLAAIDDGNVTT